jgi:uncharacterized NAD(P)/FAD-binding protein YdhS
MKDVLVLEPSRNPNGAAPVHVVIVGGGASGVLMALHLLRQSAAAFRVTVIEGSHPVGQGIAYSTRDPEHLLNTRVQNMSALRDEPGHFLTWLKTQKEGRGATDQCFVSRGTYGAYLKELLSPWAAGGPDGRLRLVYQNCIEVSEGTRGVAVMLGNGETIRADHAVLATGHVVPDRNDEWLLQGSWDKPDGVPEQARVVIIGSGLSMVDQVLSLLRMGHHGPILSVSRRGLLPRDHAATRPMNFLPGDIPLGEPMPRLLAWARQMARQAERAGGSWRDAVDGIRPHVRAIWLALPLAERGRFLRHAATWWDVHRHRIPPQSQATILDAMRRGQLSVVKGSYAGATDRLGGGVLAHYRPFGKSDLVAVVAARIVDCRGIRRDPEKNASPLVAGLLSRGVARVDPLRIGLDVDEAGRLIGQSGVASQRIWAIGPAARAAYWEITAIPDIREQVAELAARLSEAAPEGQHEALREPDLATALGA